MKYFPVIAERESTNDIREEIEKVIKNEEKKNNGMPSLSFVESIELCDAIVVIGGDGFLLQAMRDFYKYQKPFLGLHAGTLGFLHNHMHVSELPTSLERLQIVESELLEVTCTQEDGTLVEALCVNDCIVGNHMIDYFTYDVLIGTKSEKVSGSGLVLATSVGATGYALNNGAPLMPLTSNLWCLTGIASRPFHYSFLEPGEIKITVHGKSSCTVGCDGHGHIIEQVRSLIIKPSNKKVSLSFCPDQDFQKRRLLMAAEKLGT